MLFGPHRLPPSSLEDSLVRVCCGAPWAEARISKASPSHLADLQIHATHKIAQMRLLGANTMCHSPGFGQLIRQKLESRYKGVRESSAHLCSNDLASPAITVRATEATGAIRIRGIATVLTSAALTGDAAATANNVSLAGAVCVVATAAFDGTGGGAASS